MLWESCKGPHPRSVHIAFQEMDGYRDVCHPKMCHVEGLRSYRFLQSLLYALYVVMPLLLLVSVRSSFLPFLRILSPPLSDRLASA